MRGMTIDQLLDRSPRFVKERVAAIRTEKANDSRNLPSTQLVDRSQLLTAAVRGALIDRIAMLVDENLFGRSEMCLQFAELLDLALKHLSLPSRSVVGTAIYIREGREVFRWEHAWVRIGREVVDGNVDSICENPLVPDVVSVAPYWGPIDQTPPDRQLHQDKVRQMPSDGDVARVWWPELREWLEYLEEDGARRTDHTKPQGS